MPRLQERVIYVLHLAQLCLQVQDHNIRKIGGVHTREFHQIRMVVNYAFVMMTIFCAANFGLRAQQLHLIFGLLAVVSQLLSEFFKVEDYAEHSIVFISINCIVVILTLIMWKRYGECDFEKAKPNGPFAVGCREMYAAGNGA